MASGGSGAGYSAFISHASDDAEVARKIADHLEARGFRCWIAPRDVRPGQDYPSEIIRGIEHSKCLVLVLSSKSNESKFVRAEVERAYSKAKPVFPVRVEDVIPSRGLELFISTKHWIDAWKGELSQHASALATEIARDADLELELSPALRRRARMRRLVRYAAGAAGVAAIAVVIALVMRPGSRDSEASAESGYSKPVTAFFTGGLVRSGKPVEVGFMLTDGYSNGKPLGAFEHEMALEVYEVRKGAAPGLLYAAKPGQFAGQFQSTKSYRFKLDALPKKVLSCVIFQDPVARERRATFQAFNFDLPDSQFGTSPITDAAAPHTVKVDASANCGGLAAKYAAIQFKSLQ